MFTLSVIFNQSKNAVLMCWHTKQQAYNFIGGKTREMEPEIDASYREVEEETGITKDDLKLFFVRREQVSSMAFGKKNGHTWSMYVTTGVLNKSVKLKEGENQLRWVPIVQFKDLLDSMFGYGNCYTYLLESIEICERNRL